MGSYFSRNRSPATELERIALEIGDLKKKIERISTKQSTVLYYYCMFIFVIFTISTAHTWLRYENPKKSYVAGALAAGAIAIILIGRYIINAFFAWRTKSTAAKLEHTISQKSVLLDLVKETLKFKEAKEILDRYDVDEDKKNPTSPNRSAPASPSGSTLQLLDKTDNNKNIAMTPKRATSPLANATPTQNPNQTVRPASSMSNIAMTPYYQRNPNAGPVRPYLRQTGPLDRVLDYFMSDGPGCRNALICSICHTHNGMASPAEYPFLSFRCFECGHMNQAKKQGKVPKVDVSQPMPLGMNGPNGHVGPNGPNGPIGPIGPIGPNGEVKVIRKPVVVPDPSDEQPKSDHSQQHETGPLENDKDN